jgi:preprotein translocase subunit SecA
LEGLGTRLKVLFGYEPDMRVQSMEDPKPLETELFDQVIGEYERREHLIGDELRDSFKQQIGGDDANIDFDRLARRRVHDLELMALLSAVDDKWIDHLRSMDYLRESVRLRAFGQKDPLLEFKTEGFEEFQDMILSVYESVIQTLFRLTDPEVRHKREINARKGILTTDEDPFSQIARYQYIAADKEQDRSFASYDTSKFALAGQDASAQEQDGRGEGPKPKARPVKRVGPKIKPNDPCHCGSGKKYKKCHGAIQN